jgi:hypothetical protein
MSKTNKKSINLALKTLTILAFVLIFVPFNKAAAQEVLYGYGANLGSGSNYGGNYGNSYNNSYYNNPVYQAPIYTPTPAPTPIVYSNTNNPNPVMTVNYTPAKVATVKTKTVAKAPSNANAVAANAVYGSSGFLPSGLIQWILFAIFVLLIVILSRRIFGAKEKYQTAPLKHE